MQGSGSLDQFDIFNSLHRHAIVAGRVTVDIGVDHDTVLSHVVFPTSVSIQATVRHIDLVARTIHIIDKSAGDLGKNLAAGFFGQIGREILNRQDGTFAATNNVCAVDIREFGGYVIESKPLDDYPIEILIRDRIRLTICFTCIGDDHREQEY